MRFFYLVDGNKHGMKVVSSNGAAISVTLSVKCAHMVNEITRAQCYKTFYDRNL